MRFKFRALACLVVLISLTFLGACSTKKSSTANGSGVLYVTTQGDSLITPYTIDLSTGKFTALGKAVATDSMPSAVVLSAKGDALFVANSASNSVTAYAVNSDGTLAAAGSTQTGGTDPVSMAMDAAGHLFVVNEVSRNISIFTVSGTTLGPPVLFSTIRGLTGTDPSAVAITPNGHFLYITDKVDATVTEYNVDSSGNLSQPVPFPVCTSCSASSPSALIITNLTTSGTPTSNFLYVANSGSSNVSAFSICDNPSTTCLANPPDGALTALASSPFAAGLAPVAMALDPAFKFLYVVDSQSNQVSEYKVSTGTGALTPLSTSPIGTGNAPTSIAIRSGGATVQSTGGTTTYVYVANQGASTVTIFAYDSTVGQLGLITAAANVSGQPSAVATK